MPRLVVSIPLLMTVLVAGCAGSLSTYPSLAPRAVEKGDATTVAPAVAAVAPLPPAVLALAASLVEKGKAGDTAFATASRGACAAIDRGRGAATGSEAWVAAQQAVSALEAERLATTAALDDANALVLDQARLAQDSARPVDLTPLTAAATDLAAMDAAQGARLTAIKANGCRP